MEETTFELEADSELILVYSLLSKTTVKILAKKRRETIKSFIKLLQTISFGSGHSTEGDFIKFTPGSLRGGDAVVKCVDEISTYIVPLLVLCPFIEKPLRIKFKGITNDRLCVDLIRIAHLSVLRKFGIDKCELVVKKRGFAPEGRGEVVFSAPKFQKIRTIDLVEEEKLTKIRGLVLSSRLSSIPTKEMTDKIKELMSDIANTRVFSSASNKLDSGPSPGFQCTVFAESKNGVYYFTQGGERLTPGETAAVGCRGLLKSIKRGGIFDKKLLGIAFSLMALSSTNVGQLRICKIDDELQNVLDLLKMFFGFEYDIRRSGDSYIISATGCGFTNINKSLG